MDLMHELGHDAFQLMCPFLDAADAFNLELVNEGVSMAVRELRLAPRNAGIFSTPEEPPVSWSDRNTKYQRHRLAEHAQDAINWCEQEQLLGRCLEFARGTTCIQDAHEHGFSGNADKDPRYQVFCLDLGGHIVVNAERFFRLDAVTQKPRQCFQLHIHFPRLIRKSRQTIASAPEIAALAFEHGAQLHHPWRSRETARAVQLPGFDSQGLWDAVLDSSHQTHHPSERQCSYPDAVKQCVAILRSFTAFSLCAHRTERPPGITRAQLFASVESEHRMATLMFRFAANALLCPHLFWSHPFNPDLCLYALPFLHGDYETDMHMRERWSQVLRDSLDQDEDAHDNTSEWKHLWERRLPAYVSGKAKLENEGESAKPHWTLQIQPRYGYGGMFPHLLPRADAMARTCKRDRPSGTEAPTTESIDVIQDSITHTLAFFKLRDQRHRTHLRFVCVGSGFTVALESVLDESQQFWYHYDRCLHIAELRCERVTENQLVTFWAWLVDHVLLARFWTRFTSALLVNPMHSSCMARAVAQTNAADKYDSFEYQAGCGKRARCFRLNATIADGWTKHKQGVKLNPDHVYFVEHDPRDARVSPWAFDNVIAFEQQADT